MGKTIFVTVLICGIVYGAAWYAFGRVTTADISRSIRRGSEDLERVERIGREFGSDFDRYAGKMAGLNQASLGLGEQTGDIRGRFQSEIREIRSGYAEVQSGLQYFSDGTNSIEESVRRIVILSRDSADNLYWYRKRLEYDGEEDESGTGAVDP